MHQGCRVGEGSSSFSLKQNKRKPTGFMIAAYPACNKERDAAVSNLWKQVQLRKSALTCYDHCPAASQRFSS